MRVARSGLAVTLAVLMSAVGAAPAGAHAAVRSRTPAPGATVATVRTVTIRFADAVITGRISLTTTTGRAIPVRSAGLSASKAALQVRTRSALPSGSYRVSWRARADDGHHQRGSWTFRVR